MAKRSFGEKERISNVPASWTWSDFRDTIAGEWVVARLPLVSMETRPSLNTYRSSIPEIYKNREKDKALYSYSF